MLLISVSKTVDETCLVSSHEWYCCPFDKTENDKEFESFLEIDIIMVCYACIGGVLLFQNFNIIQHDKW